MIHATRHYAYTTRHYAYTTQDRREISNFVKRLKDSMRSKNIRQKELASVLGITRQSISSYLNGKSCPNVITLARICKALNVSADYLIGLRDGGKTAGEIESEISDVIKSIMHDLRDIMTAYEPNGGMSNGRNEQ